MLVPKNLHHSLYHIGLLCGCLLGYGTATQQLQHARRTVTLLGYTSVLGFAMPSV